MNLNERIPTMVVSVVVAIVIIAGVLFPVVGQATTTTVTIENEGSTGIKFTKVTSGDYTVTFGLSGDDFVATNGTDTQTIDTQCILYADENVGVWIGTDDNIHLLGVSDNTTQNAIFLDSDATITVTKTSSGVTIADGTITKTFGVPTWAYVPSSTGTYGYFENGTEVTVNSDPVCYVGSYAGVDCYNSINTYDLPITLDATITDGVLSDAKWIRIATENNEQQFNPDNITINPINPDDLSIIDNPIITMSVPIPTYTDGDWGYDTTNVDGVTKAIIVSYSGSGGGIITVPSTVGGYDVIQVGKGWNNSVMNSSVVASGLVISNGIEVISADAFMDCTSLTGTLVLPNTLKKIDYEAFKNCSGFTGQLVIPDSVEVIGATSGNNTSGGSFNGCTGFTSLVLGNSLKTIGVGAFMNCKFEGSLIIPDSVENILHSAFYGCNKITSLKLSNSLVKLDNSSFNSCSLLDGTIVLPNSLTTIGKNSFVGCQKLDNLVNLTDSTVTITSPVFPSSIKNVLNLGTLELTTTSYGLSADEISDNIPCTGYLATSVVETKVASDDPTSQMLTVIPLLLIIGILIAVVGLTISRR